VIRAGETLAELSSAYKEQRWEQRRHPYRDQHGDGSFGWCPSPPIDFQILHRSLVIGFSATEKLECLAMET
jgi:hypothetical protein